MTESKDFTLSTHFNYIKIEVIKDPLDAVLILNLKTTVDPEDEKNSKVWTTSLFLLEEIPEDGILPK